MDYRLYYLKKICLSGKKLSRYEHDFKRIITDWIVDGSYTGDTTLTELADKACLCRNEAVSFIKKHTGSTFVSMRLRLRIQRSQELLTEHPELSVASIAEEVGFNDRSTFRHCFRMIEGCTPSEWRNKTRHQCTRYRLKSLFETIYW